MTPCPTPEASARERTEYGSPRPGCAMKCLRIGMLRRDQRRLTFPPYFPELLTEQSEAQWSRFVYRTETPGVEYR